MNRTNKFLSLCACFVLASSCSENGRLFERDGHDTIDAEAKLTRQDFKDIHNLEAYMDPSGAKISANVLEPPIPDLAEILAAPKAPKIAQTQLVSVAVTDDVPLKDMLIELARLADIDIEVDAGITGGISFRAKDRPFNEVVERIADLAGLRYKVQNNVLRVERDNAYIHTYALDMLNIDRASQGNISTGSSGSGGAAAGGGGGGRSGSTGSSSSSITAESKSDFWKQFEESITKILAQQPANMVSGVTVAAQPPAATEPGAPPAPVPVAPPPSGVGNSSALGAFYSLNRQAGTLTISATERQHEIIRRFLKEIESNVSSQVLIEAKIVEVTLNDNYQTGINWSQLGGDTMRFSGDFSDVAATTGPGAATITFIKNELQGSSFDLSGAVNLLDEFGTTRALSSPRINAMNNQQAMLSFVENLLYFEVDCEVTDKVPATATTTETPAKVSVESSVKTSPIGIILSLQPSINRETGEITLSVRPTLTKFVKFASDPGFELCKAQAIGQIDDATVIAALQAIKSEYPQIESRELDSIMKIRSGQIMVIGGLLEDKTINNDSGVPGVGEIPYFGNLFKSVDKVTQKKELVILLRATIVDTQGYMDQADKAIYKKFIQDPRPINFPEPQ